MSSLVETVRKDIIEAIESDQLTLPTLPEVAMRVRDIAEDPEAGIGDLAQIISQDAALAARIIRVTNSPLLRAPQEVKDLNMAISRLGMNYTANLAIGLAMEQMFQATSEVIDVRLRKIWNDTASIATLAYVIAQSYTKIPPDEATLAALVHRLGALPILTYAEENEMLLNDGITLDKLIKVLHPELGRMILEKWDFAESLRNLPLEFEKFEAKTESIDYADIIRIANLIHFHNSGHYSEVLWPGVPSFRKLKIMPDYEDEMIQNIVAQSESAGGMFSTN